MNNKGNIQFGNVGGDVSDVNLAGEDIVKGSNVNIGSTLSNVTQQVETMGQGSLDEKAELEEMLKQLEAELKKLPADHQEDAEIVAEYTQDLMEEAGKEKPRKGKLKITGEGLKKAAENLLEAAPLVGEIAGKIALKVLTLGA